MKKETDHLKELAEIRSIMEQSTRFLSLSGLAGIFAGFIALLGALAAYLYLNIEISSNNYYDFLSENGSLHTDRLFFFAADAIIVLILALGFGIYYTRRNAKRKGQSIWNTSVKKMLGSLFVPLFTAGILCIVLVYYGVIFLVAPLMLIFYGLALISASKYTLRDIWYMGIIEILLGLTACFFPGYGLLFWAFGFGVMHIVYGALMFYKYEK